MFKLWSLKNGECLFISNKSNNTKELNNIIFVKN